MQPDVTELRSFYATPLGSLSARLIANKIRKIWPDVTRQSVLGLGYALPYLKPFLHNANTPERVIALMPAAQGVLAWPNPASGKSIRQFASSGRPQGNLTTLADEVQLPLPDASFDRIIMAHVLENSEQTRALLREVWRVLSPSGRILALVPNRGGIWAPFDKTPFGTGRPYSRHQLNETLADNMLTPLQWRYILHIPPFENRAALKVLKALERPDQIWWRRMAGVLIMEAEKQIYAINSDEGSARKGVRRGVAANISQERRNSSRSPS